MATRLKDWCVVAISGVTNGGKTTLAIGLKDTFQPVAVISQDDYFFPDDSDKHVKVAGLDHNNYDILSSLDMERMHRDVLRIIGSSSSANSNPPGTYAGKKMLIIEGFLVLNYKPLYDLSDYKCYIELSKDECMKRRVNRVYDPPDIPGYFELCVWPEYEKYRKEVRLLDGVKFIDGADSNILETVVEDIVKLYEK